MFRIEESNLAALYNRKSEIARLRRQTNEAGKALLKAAKCYALAQMEYAEAVKESDKDVKDVR